MISQRILNSSDTMRALCGWLRQRGRVATSISRHLHIALGNHPDSNYTSATRRTAPFVTSRRLIMQQRRCGASTQTNRQTNRAAHAVASGHERAHGLHQSTSSKIALSRQFVARRQNSKHPHWREVSCHAERKRNGRVAARRWLSPSLAHNAASAFKSIT